MLLQKVFYLADLLFFCRSFIKMSFCFYCILHLQQNCHMMQIFTVYLPGLIIQACLFYYLIKRKTRLSYILFFSSFISFILINTTHLFVMHPGRTGSLAMFLMFNWIPVVLHFVYAIAFCFFIRDVLRPTEKKYQFLDESKNEGAQL